MTPHVAPPMGKNRTKPESTDKKIMGENSHNTKGVMMKFTLEIEMDNCAFAELNGAEVARILHNLADKVDYKELQVIDTILLRDINGNRVGFAEVKEL